MLGSTQEQSLQEAFVEQLEEFNQRFARRPGCFRLFFGHFGVTSAKVSSGQSIVGPLLHLQAQYVGLSHIHLRQQLAPRVWYAGSLSRCDCSEVEDKGYNLVILKAPELAAELSDLDVEFRLSPTRALTELRVRYEDGKFRLPDGLDLSRLKDSRVRVFVKVANGQHGSLHRDEQDRLRDMLLAADPAEIKLKIEHEPEAVGDVAPISLAKTATEKLRAYWEMKGAPPVDLQARLLAKLVKIETAVAYERTTQ